MNANRILLGLALALAALLPACAPAQPDATTTVRRYYAAVNAKQLDTAMTFIAEAAVFVNPYGKFTGRDDIRASLQLVMNDGITFELSNLRGTNGRVVYDYKVFVNGEQVETGADGLTVVKDGRITLDATERWEWMAYANTITFTAEATGFGGPETLPAGWAEITLTNNTQAGHHVQLVKLDEGQTPEALKAALEADPENFPAWAIPYGGPNAPDPGGSTSAIVHLEAGNYALISVIPDAEGVPGFLNGMLKAVTVTAVDGATALEPQADLTVELVDFGLNLSGEAAAGERIIRFDNAGQQVHEAYLVKLNEGATADTYLNTPPTEPPPAAGLGGITGIAPGAHQYVRVTLEPGRYALFCFFPDPSSHAPHFALGMVKEFTVR